MSNVWRFSLLVGFSFCSMSSLALGQAFTQAEGAVVGTAAFGQGQALYGGVGLDSANDPEFNVYRKYNVVADESELSSATNVPGNLGEIEWNDVNQRQQGTLDGQEKNVLTAPGMFIGTKTHTNADGWVTTNPDQLLYFKPLLDNEDDLVTEDSNRNAFWGTRIGFMESPEDYLDFVEPNSQQLDLWTGQLNTDTVYGPMNIRRDDSLENTNATSQHGAGGSFYLSSGSEFSSYADERGRTRNELSRVQAGTGEEVEQNSRADTGVAYADPVEVSWGMRLNDPDNTDEIFAREVEFWVKTGNIIASGVFDPGGGEDSPADLPPNDDFEDFTDFAFDWQNAKPVFYAGGEGLVQGTGRMGFFLPGDFGADGEVNLDDFNRLASNFGGEDTTYSRGDYTQDGVTDLADITAWADIAGTDAKANALSAVEADSSASGSLYDFDGSGATDAADITFVSELFGDVNVCTPGNGDLNGDGAVGFPDFLVLSSNFGNAADSVGGDINCDGTVGFPDFLVLSANFGTTVGQAQSVPEPHGLLLLCLAALPLSFLRKRRA